jgi:hypothetical protein
VPENGLRIVAGSSQLNTESVPTRLVRDASFPAVFGPALEEFHVKSQTFVNRPLP